MASTPKYAAKTFNIPELKGISKKSIEEHLKLYEGYVKHTNLILEKIEELRGSEKDAYALGEMQRRFGFEFDGMRNHEYYFASLEGGAKSLGAKGALKKAIEKEWKSFDTWLSSFKTLAKTRGIGWALLLYDPKGKRLLTTWVDEQHLGHLTGLTPVLVLDMWEHSYVGDYWSSGKGTYIDDFFANLNWEVIERNFSKAYSCEC